MSLKNFLFSLLILSSTFATGCSKHVVLEGDSSIQHVFFDEDASNLLNYNFKITDINNIDETLSNQRYLYSTSINNNYVAVILYQSENASINHYPINNDGSVDLTIPKDSPFILSFHANRTIAYTWNIKNPINNGIVKLKNRSWINIPMPQSLKDSEGMNYDRQNFYFKPAKSGNEKIVMRYEHESEQRDEFFEVTFNITIE